MAFFGLSDAYIASLNTSTGAYSNAIKVGEAISTSVTPNNVEGSLYGDNKLTEKVTEFANATVEAGVTTVPADAIPMLFGHTVNDDGEEVSNSGDTAPFVGFGFIVKEIKGGVEKYRACLLHKVQFTEGEEGYETKGDAINFVTPTLSGTALPDNNGNWRTKSEAFASKAAAEEWLKGKLGETASGSGD